MAATEAHTASPRGVMFGKPSEFVVGNDGDRAFEGAGRRLFCVVDNRRVMLMGST